MAKKNDSNSSEPTFDKQADYSLGDQDTTDPIFSRAYHQFITDMLKHRDKNLLKETEEAYDKKVAEHYDPIMTLLKKMDEGQTKLSQDISDIKIDMGHMKCDIIGIRQQVKIIKDENEKVHHELKTQIDELKSEINPIKEKASWSAIVWRGIVIALLAVITAMALLYFTFEWFQNHHFIGLLSF